MQPFLPREKMSKRERRAMDASRRTTWDNVNPVTRKTENKKAYNRKKSPRWYNDDSTGIFVCRCALSGSFIPQALRLPRNPLLPAYHPASGWRAWRASQAR